MNLKNSLAFFLLFSLFLLMLALAGCDGFDGSLRRIKQKGKLVVITDNSAHGYYLFKDAPKGFEYDLAKTFANDIGVELKILTPGWDKMIDNLMSGEGDLIASSLTKTARRESKISFSESYMTVQQHIVVRKGNNSIKKLSDLNGKTIHIRKNTSYEERLSELIDQGMDIRMVVYENIPTEEFLRWIQYRKIDITVADTHVVQLNHRYYPDIRKAFTISEKQEIGWAVRKTDTALLRKINRFMKTIQKNGEFQKIYDTYYAGTEMFDYVNIKKFHLRMKTRFPKYKKLIVETAKTYKFDWRLIAALIYQESEFLPHAKSHTGVRGLMQLTRITAQEMGINNRLNPDQSVQGGVRYLNRLKKRFDHIDESQRIKFALGSYNVGYGHIVDAQKIAEEKGLDPNEWESLEETLPLLQHPEYFKKTFHGYARGWEPVEFVNRVLKYYDILVKTNEL